MATWALTTTLTAEHIINVVSSGTDLYFVGKATAFTARPLHVDGDVWEYDLATGVETKIIQQATYSGIGQLTCICWFKGTLYLAIRNSDGGFPINHAVAYIYKWNGTADSISLVHTTLDENYTFPDIGSGAAIYRLYTDGETMVVVAIGNNVPADTILTEIVESTSNGTAYSSGSLPFTAQSIVSSTRYSFAVECPVNSIYELLYDQADSLWKGVKFSGGSFALHQATLPGSSNALLYTDPGLTLHFNTFNGSDHYFNLAMSTSTQTDPTDIGAVIQVNLDYSIGIDLASGDIYTTSNGTWALLDAASFTGIGSTSTWIVRADNADVFLIARNGASSNSEVWTRSEGIPFPVASVAQFYSGLDTLTYRSDLPFAGVNPGAMAVLANRTVVLGSNAAAAQSVIYSTPESYPGWTDMTPVIPTGTSVTSIKNV